MLELTRTATPEAAVVEMVFSPIQTLVRVLGDSVTEYFRVDPALAHRIISQVVDALARYAAGLDGFDVDVLFAAANGTSEGTISPELTPEQFRDWVTPYDIQVLVTTPSLVRIAHPYGEDVDPELITDYPAKVLSWSNTSSTPTIPGATSRCGWVPMVGIDEFTSPH